MHKPRVQRSYGTTVQGADGRACLDQACWASQGAWGRMQPGESGSECASAACARRNRSGASILYGRETAPGPPGLQGHRQPEAHRTACPSRDGQVRERQNMGPPGRHGQRQAVRTSLDRWMDATFAVFVDAALESLLQGGIHESVRRGIGLGQSGGQEADLSSLDAEPVRGEPLHGLRQHTVLHGQDA